ncbi:hypothetical protein P261_01635 [Lachnospiraceae bacterium TWA4]|nr:hypothetical protein P261_01635 [Lachnospiraceae bacterium TWA4]
MSLIGNKVYYFKVTKETKTNYIGSVCTYDLSKSKTTTLGKNLKIPLTLPTFTSKYMMYYDSNKDNFYKYTYSTKKRK